MLRLSKLTDYGIVIMTCLAKTPGEVHTAQYVADCTQVSLPTVSKLLKQLNRAGLVASVRGARGGYQIARDAVEISVADVVTALEGPVALTECATDEGNCDQESVCSVRGNWNRINQAIVGALDDISMAEMAGTTTAVVLKPVASA